MHQNACQACAISYVLRRFEPDACWHGRVADEALDHLDGLGGSHE